MTDSLPSHAASDVAAGAGDRATLTVSRKRPEDTPAGCRLLAAADMRRATVADGHSSWRYEHSAAAWTARADMLSQHEAEFQARFTGTRA